MERRKNEKAANEIQFKVSNIPKEKSNLIQSKYNRWDPNYKYDNPTSTASSMQSSLPPAASVARLLPSNDRKKDKEDHTRCKKEDQVYFINSLETVTGIILLCQRHYQRKKMIHCWHHRWHEQHQ